jgi:alkanesulfonate monooxygenase SsuD/methylene tetrahydromethanopterin reductase-like flavin-dependent oxidoreductase (luciferase family)
MRIAARHADEWNTWGTPEVLAHKVGVLRRYCEEVGRDPSEIQVSCQALVTFDELALEGRAASRMLTGPVEALREAMGAYAEAGVDEFIVPDFNLGSGAARQEVVDRFRAEVASSVTRS